MRGNSPSSLSARLRSPRRSQPQTSWQVAPHLLYGPEFDPAVPLLRILAAALPLAILGASLSALWLLPHGRDRAVTTIVVLSGLLAIILIVTTTPTLGLEAAAWSLVAVELATVAGLLVAVRRPVRALSP